jgi:hypothetical protein
VRETKACFLGCVINVESNGTAGFEGLTISSDKKTLYALLQSGTVQDGEAQFTRLVAFDVSNTSVRPTPTGEWVVPLPTKSSSGKVRSASEVHFVSDNIFLALSRDGNGRGGGTSSSDLTSSYKFAPVLLIFRKMCSYALKGKRISSLLQTLQISVVQSSTTLQTPSHPTANLTRPLRPQRTSPS